MRLVDNAGSVRLTYHDRFTDTEVSRTFWVSSGGGYVREHANMVWGGQQVCERLSTRGNTLWATPDNLAQVIRREYRRMRARERMRRQTDDMITRERGCYD